MSEIVRRLRKWAERWPDELNTADLVTEAANRIDGLARLNKFLNGQLQESRDQISGLRNALEIALLKIAIDNPRQACARWFSDARDLLYSDSKKD